MTSLLRGTESCWSEIPEIICPRCQARWQPHDLADLDVGAIRDCPQCGVNIEMMCLIREWEWATCGPPDEPDFDEEPGFEP